MGVHQGIVYLGGSSAANCDDNKDLFRQHTFISGTHAIALSSTSFYLAESGLRQPPETPISSLYRISLQPNGNVEAPSELITGVDNMRARYGVLGSTGDIIYLTANSFNGTGQDIDGDAVLEDFGNVVSLEVSLLLKSSVARNGRSSNSRQTLSFLDINGDTVDCNTEVNNALTNSACPSFINATSDEKGRYRRVVRKLFNLRNITL